MHTGRVSLAVGAVAFKHNDDDDDDEEDEDED